MTAFEAMAAEFERRVSTIVWASVSSVNARGRTRVRVMHSVWELFDMPGGPTGWVGTSRRTSLARHLEVNPHVSISYVAVSHNPWLTEQLYADCTAHWADTPEERAHAWQLMQSLPEPYGFDPAASWGSVDNEDVGFLRLTPWRIELASLGTEDGWSQQIWRAE